MKPFPVLALLLLCRPGSAHSAETMDRLRQQSVIEKTIEHVNANYVFPDRAREVETALREKIRAGLYEMMTKPDDFLDALNRDLQAAGRDKHLRVIYNPKMAARLRQEAAGAKEVSPEFLEMLRQENFRLRKVESLDGNVGYFKFDNFAELQFVKDPFVGAMNFLNASSALVIDLTDNGGGASETADLLLSYFLPEGTHTGETWNRATGETKISTVVREAGVKPMLDVPLFVLVGERTASAAEAVAYTLQQAKRATVIGSRTKGLANAGQHFLIDDSLFVMVPTLLGKNPVSGTNWEGVGVAPDVGAAPGKALDVALEQALLALAERARNDQERFRLRFLAAEYAALVAPQPPPAGFLEACLGEYEDGQRIVMTDGALRYVKGSVYRRLSYMSDRTFAVEGRKDYRLRFPGDAKRVKGLEVLWLDDTSDKFAKTN